MLDIKNDIYGMIKRLRAARITDDHAEAIANEISIATYNYHSNEYLDIKFNELISKFNIKIQKVKVEILKWFIGISVIQTVTVVVSVLAAG